MRNRYWWDPFNEILRVYNHLQSTRKGSTRVQLKREYKRIHYLNMNLLYTQQKLQVLIYEKIVAATSVRFSLPLNASIYKPYCHRKNINLDIAFLRTGCSWQFVYCLSSLVLDLILTTKQNDTVFILITILVQKYNC